MPRYTRVIKKEAHSTTVGILSAGIGNKIKSYEPRSLIKVGSDSLLSYQVNLINNLFTAPEIIVGVGVGANKIMKKGYPKDSVRLVENQNYSSTGSFETLRLVVNNCTTDTLLIMHGDLYFNAATLDSLDYSKSFVIVDSSGMLSKKEVGVTSVRDKATILSHGLPMKWGQIAYFCGKEFQLLKNVCNKSSEDTKKFLSFEALNMVINKGGNLYTVEPKGMSILEIDCMKDLKNEDFNI